jgi:hypothetical protein
VLDFDQLDGVFCLAMEYLSGRTLTAVQDQLQKQPPPDVLRHSGWVAAFWRAPARACTRHTSCATSAVSS